MEAQQAIGIVLRTVEFSEPAYREHIYTRIWQNRSYSERS